MPSGLVFVLFYVVVKYAVARLIGSYAGSPVEAGITAASVIFLTMFASLRRKRM